MPNISTVQQNLAIALKTCVSASAASVASLGDLLCELIDSIPAYGSPDFLQSHRNAIVNLLEIRLPNAPIAPFPTADKPLLVPLRYSGSYSGYQNAFFDGVSFSPAASALESTVSNPLGVAGVSVDWWGKFAVAALTDTIRRAGIGSIDGGKLANDLNNFNSAFLPLLTASYLSVFRTAYTPTSSVLASILNCGQAAAAGTMLVNALKDGRFVNLVNTSMTIGGDAALAAEWFLFNLWITLAALDESDIDSKITEAMQAGLAVPGEVGPKTDHSPGWWCGGYTGWFEPISGNDVAPQASGTIHEQMPQQGYWAGEGIDWRDVAPEPDGYSLSLCNWGPLNFYSAS
ncbi:hypothetical protein [Paraburkholderia pallida]|uniref:Uncharacterized protein n=1 Tax=Paraburkholderia pallida TaxID=2547399 RepID=A0A4P7DA53_9BURK|nr:hypothetical protein [Paraburkholderia pallida]QBR03764.1 hypothetical protein E1956_42515 [Paraburkholderia pallida]